MAKIAEELFEGGADEAAVTTSNSTATAVTGTVKFDTAFAVEGTRSARVDGSSNGYVAFRLASPPTALYARWYQRFASPVDSSDEFLWVVNSTGASNIAFFRFSSNTPTRVRLYNASPFSLVATSTWSPPLDEWVRFELLSQGTQQTLRIFTGANLHGTTPDGTLTGTVASGSGGWHIGMPTSVGTANATWVDAFAADNADWVGPYVAPVTITGTLAASLPALTTGITGTVTWPTVTGALAATLPTPTVAVTGTVTWPVRTGALAGQLPVPTVAATGTVTWLPVDGQLQAQLPALTTALAGTVAWPASTGQLAATLPTPAVSLTADTPTAGTLAAALPRLTATVTGDIGDARAGYLTATLTAPTVTLAGHVHVASTLTAALPSPTVTLAGDITTPAAVVTGSLDVLLPGLEAHMAGTGPPVTAHHVLFVGTPRPGLVAGAPRPGLTVGPPRVPVTVGSPT